MIKIGITGSLASGKTTASKFISGRNGPLFSADLNVKKLYTNYSFGYDYTIDKLSNTYLEE